MFLFLGENGLWTQHVNIIALSALLGSVLTHSIKSGPQPKDCKAAKINGCSVESKAFPRSAGNRIAPISFVSV